METIKINDNQNLEFIYLKAIKMCIDDYPTREEMKGIYKFLAYLSSENEGINK